jgi:hypothetical protein
MGNGANCGCATPNDLESSQSEKALGHLNLLNPTPSESNQS